MTRYSAAHHFRLQLNKRDEKQNYWLCCRFNPKILQMSLQLTQQLKAHCVHAAVSRDDNKTPTEEMLEQRGS